MATYILTNGINRLEVTTTEDDDCETVGELLDLYRDQLNVPAGSVLAADGERIDADSPLPEDDATISVSKPTGSKG